MTCIDRRSNFAGDAPDPTARQFVRTASVGREVTLSWPWNPYNNKIGSSVTGTVFKTYRNTRDVHPVKGPSGV